MKKIMNRRIVFIYLMMVVVMSLCSCGNGEKSISEEEAVKIGNELKNSDIFSTGLSSIDGKIVLNSYGITDEDISVLVSYIGDGISPEEITVLKGNKNELKKIIDEYISRKAELYSGYLPEESYKIKNAIFKQYGDISIVCISNNNDKAKKIIEK